MDFDLEKLARFKWPIQVNKNIKASTSEVWETISKPGNLNDCHPFCEKNTVKQWPGVGAQDTINYYSGWALQREFINWYPGVGYDLAIHRKGGRKSHVSWRIKEVNKNISNLKITLYVDRLQNTPVLFRWLPHFAYLRPKMKLYLLSVVSGFDWFITTGKPVTENQFGAHPWFSGK